MARLRADPPRHGLARGPRWPSASRSTRSTTSARPTWCSRSTPTSCSAARATSATRPISWIGGACGRPNRTPHRPAMNRLYVVETAVSCTGRQGRPSAGAAAGGDRSRWPARDGRDNSGCCRRRGTTVAGPSAGSMENGSPPWPRTSTPIAAAAWCWPATGSRPIVHLLAHAMNDHLGNVGQTVTYTAPIDARPGDRTAVAAGTGGGHGPGRVEMLVILGGNPVYTAPADLKFAGTLAKGAAAESITASTWTRPRTNATGTCPRPITWRRGATPGPTTGPRRSSQPLIEPLYQGRSAHEVMALLARCKRRRATRSSATTGGSNSRRIQARAVRGGLANGAAQRRGPRHEVPEQDRRVRQELGGARQELALTTPLPQAGEGSNLAASQAGEGGFEPAVRGRPDDLRRPLRQNGWLQECPEPATKLAWTMPC